MPSVKTKCSFMSGSLQKKYNLYLVYNLNLWGGGGGGKGLGGWWAKGGDATSVNYSLGTCKGTQGYCYGTSTCSPFRL